MSGMMEMMNVRLIVDFWQNRI